MYKIEFLKPVRRDLKKISHHARDFIINDSLSKIQNDPYTGIKLRGKFRDYYKYSINFQGVTYRAVYQIYDNEKIVLIIAIGARENFYNKLLRRLKGR